jgi:hypothetical protein
MKASLPAHSSASAARISPAVVNTPTLGGSNTKNFQKKNLWEAK